MRSNAFPSSPSTSAPLFLQCRFAVSILEPSARRAPSVWLRFFKIRKIASVNTKKYPRCAARVPTLASPQNQARLKQCVTRGAFDFTPTAGRHPRRVSRDTNLFIAIWIQHTNCFCSPYTVKNGQFGVCRFGRDGQPDGGPADGQRPYRHRLQPHARQSAVADRSRA